MFSSRARCGLTLYALVARPSPPARVPGLSGLSRVSGLARASRLSRVSSLSGLSCISGLSSHALSA
jgi:hypothetical protein